MYNFYYKKVWFIENIIRRKDMAEMKYAEFPQIRKKVSRIFFGTAMETFFSGEDGSELLDAIYTSGVNAFDCARVYDGRKVSGGLD